MDEKEYVIKITADASDAVDAIDKVDDAIEKTDAHASDLSGQLSDAAGVGSQLADAASRMAASLDTAAQASASMERAFAAANVAVEPLGESLADDLAGVQGKFSGFASELDEMQKRLIASQVSMEGLGDRIRQTISSLDADTPRAKFNELIMLAKQVDKANAAYERQSDKIIDIKLALQDATKQLNEMQAAQASIVEATRKDLTMTESRLEEFKARAQASITDGFKPTAGVTKSIETLERRAQMLRDAISGDHAKLPGYAAYASEIEGLEGTISKLQGDLERETAAIANTDRQAGLYTSRIEALTATQQESTSKAGAFASVLASVGSKLAAAASVAAKLASKLASIGKTGLGNLASAAGKVGTAIRKWAAPLANVGKAVSGLTSKFTGFLRMMTFRARRMVISSLFRDLSKNSAETAKISSSYNTAVSSMVNSSKALGAQILAAAEPILSVLGPALSKLIDTLTAGADKLSQFTARLFGQETYIKASKGVYDYANAMSESEENTKAATKAAKQFKSSVLSFDELHKLEDNSFEADDASAITGVTDAQLAKAQTQATALNEVADNLREAVQAGDFRGAGEILAEQVTKGFEWLQNVAGWSKNAEKFTRALNSLIDAANGFFGKLGAGTIGAAIGDIANTLFKGMSRMLHGIDASKIGMKLGYIISGIAKTIDWQTVGSNLVAGFQFVVDMIYGFLTSDALSQLGRAAADFFSGIVSEFTPEKVGAVFAGLVNGLANFLSDAFEPETFAEFGTKCATMLNTAFANMDASMIADGINSLVRSIAAFINNAIAGLDWGQVLSTITQIASGLDWGATFEVIALAALPALIPAVTGLAGKGIAVLGGALASGLPAIGSALASGISAIVGAIGGGIPALIAGLVAIVVGALIANWDTVKEWAGKAWEKIKDWGGKIADFFAGVWDGVVSGVSKVVDVVGGIGKGIANGVSSVGNWFGDKWNSATAFITGGDRVDTLPDSVFEQASSMATLSETSLACADAETVLSRLEASFSNTVQSAADAIISLLQQSGDIILQVDSERLARATIRGMNIADVRQNAASVTFG